MSLDAAFAKVAARKLHISNLACGTNGRWHCYLRNGSDTLKGVGFSDTAEGAIEHALSGKSIDPKMRQFEDLLG